MSILPTSFSRRRSWPPDFPSPQSRPARQFRPSSADALSFGRCFFACIVLKKGYQCWTYDATRKSLIITTLGIFRVSIFATLKMVKQLSLSDLQVTPNYLLFNIGKLFSGLDIVRRGNKKPPRGPGPPASRAPPSSTEGGKSSLGQPCCRAYSSNRCTTISVISVLSVTKRHRL